MANLQAGNSIDMSSIALWYGVVSSYSNSQITITAGGLIGTYRGNFTFDSFGQVYGQINSYEQFLNGSLDFKVTGLSLDAFTFSQRQLSGDLESIYQEAFAGPDTIIGSNEADILIGYAGSDTVKGAGSNDRIFGNSGNDFLDGGSGIDTAAYSGNQASYTLTLSPTSTTITDRRGTDGTDTLTNMEFLDFADDDFDLTNFGGSASLSEEQIESIIELYIAFFNRAPDAVGLNFWANSYAKGVSLDQMAALFVDQDETRALYPAGTTNEGFATSVYNNVLGRDPDIPGLDFWVNELDSGAVTRDQFIRTFLTGVPEGSGDAQYLQNKVDIGAYFAIHKGLTTGDAAGVMEGVNASQASVTEAVNEINDIYADALDPNNGEFLMPLVGVLDDPFAVA